MGRFLLTRLWGLLGVFLAASIIAMVVTRLAPGDAAVVIAGSEASAAQVERVREGLGLSLPLGQQYLQWLQGLFHGDLGMSYITGRPVTQIIADRIGSTVELTVAALFVMIIVGVPLGVLVGARRPGPASWIAGRLCDLLLSIPPFLLGLLLALFFGVYLRWLPVNGELSVLRTPVLGLQFLILPVIALGLPQSAAVARMVAASMRETWKSEHVTLAEAKGLRPSRITWKHVVRNSLGPAVVTIGLRAGGLLAGAVIIEAIFARAGLGALSIAAILNRDYLVLQALIVGAVVVAAILNIVTEIILARLDPRISIRG